jgi:RNA polymerase subunit RPABC4/transcription elongation factor Spt4
MEQNYLSNSEFQIAAKLALGCHQYPTTTKFCIVCHEITDPKSTFCKKEYSTKRHNDLRDYIYAIATQGCLTAQRDKRDLYTYI